MSYPPPPGEPQQPNDPSQYPPPPPSGDQPSYGPPGGYGAPGMPPGQPPYGGPGYGGGPYGPAPSSNSKSLWSLIIGIASVPLACYACLGWVGIAAIILGNNAKKEIAASGGLQSGEGQAKAGVVLGWIGVVFGTIVLVLNIILFATGNSTFDYDFETT